MCRLVVFPRFVGTAEEVGQGLGQPKGDYSYMFVPSLYQESFNVILLDLDNFSFSWSSVNPVGLDISELGLRSLPLYFV